MTELRGKVALVTGASRGTGRAVALRLAEEGMKLVVTATTPEGVQAVAEEVRATGADVHAVVGNLLDNDNIQTLADAPGQMFGGLDLLVNNAGGALWKGATECEMGDIDWVLHLNLRGMMQLTRTLLPVLLADGGGTVVNMASLAGVYCAPGAASFAAAKAGVIGWSESLFEELRGEGLKACAVCPDTVDVRGELGDHGLAPEDVAEAVVYVARSSARACPTRIVLRGQLDPAWLAEE